MRVKCSVKNSSPAVVELTDANGKKVSVGKGQSAEVELSEASADAMEKTSDNGLSVKKLAQVVYEFGDKENPGKVTGRREQPLAQE
jgi:hypothetical protein